MRAVDLTHCDDVIFPEAQFVVVVSLEVEQSLGASPPVAGHHQEVLVVLLVTLHGVVGSQVLQINHTEKTPDMMGVASTHSTHLLFFSF